MTEPYRERPRGAVLAFMIALTSHAGQRDRAEIYLTELVSHLALPRVPAPSERAP